MCSSHSRMVSILTCLLSRMGKCHMPEANLLAHPYQWGHEKLTVQWSAGYVGSYPPRLQTPSFLPSTPAALSGRVMWSTPLCGRLHRDAVNYSTL